MADSRIFGYPHQLMGKSLDVSAKRHNLIAGNIANMDTIGYHPRDLDFQKTLKRAMGEQPPDYMDKTDGRHLSFNDDGKNKALLGKDAGAQPADERFLEHDRVHRADEADPVALSRPRRVVDPQTPEGPLAHRARSKPRAGELADHDVR